MRYSSVSSNQKRSSFLAFIFSLFITNGLVSSMHSGAGPSTHPSSPTRATTPDELQTWYLLPGHEQFEGPYNHHNAPDATPWLVCDENGHEHLHPGIRCIELPAGQRPRHFIGHTAAIDLHDWRRMRAQPNEAGDALRRANFNVPGIGPLGQFVIEVNFHSNLARLRLELDQFMLRRTYSRTFAPDHILLSLNVQ